MNHDRSLGRFLARKESVEAAKWPRHDDATEVQARIGSEGKREYGGRCRQAQESAAVADFALIAIAMHVMHASDLQISPPVLIDIEDELEDLLQWPADHRPTLAADDERLAHSLRLHSHGSSFCEHAKVTKP